MELDEIAEMGEQKAKGDEYRTALAKALSSGDVAACKRFVDHGKNRNGTLEWPVLG